MTYSARYPIWLFLVNTLWLDVLMEQHNYFIFQVAIVCSLGKLTQVKMLDFADFVSLGVSLMQAILSS